MTALGVAAHVIGGVRSEEAAAGDPVELVDVTSPRDGLVIGQLALGGAATVDWAVQTARGAFPAWAATPATSRARLLLKLAAALTTHADELVELISLDNGKTRVDAKGELARSAEHLEAAATAPALLAGDTVIDVLPGLDTAMLREPLGVSAIVSPFNFPIMTGAIYWAWALACGNTVVIKPSEQAPFAATRVAELALEVGFPAGVVNVVHGARAAVEALCDHPDVASVSLVGSSATARAVYARATAAGKRAHTAGGARNPLVVLPDADLEATADAVIASAYTMAGQRCLSGSILVAVGDIHDELVELVAERARALVTGPGDDVATQVPPLISRAAVDALVATIDAAETAGARIVVDGRASVQPDGGYTHGPTLLVDVPADSPLVSAEAFGPIVSVVRMPDLDAAIEFVNASPFGNAGSVFTRSGRDAREFTKRADVGNIGVNVGVAAPTAQIGFGGRRRSFLGTVHSQGRHAVEFYTDIKSVSTRWS